MSNRHLADKYFSNRTSAEETRNVLEWFATQAGSEYLERRLRIDESLMAREELRELVPELNSDRIYKTIQKQIADKPGVTFSKENDWLGLFLKVAATILVVFLAVYFSYTHVGMSHEVVTSMQRPIIYQTLGGENKNLTLADGSVIRMNSNTRIEVSPNYLNGTREVTLLGEAYFDIKYDPNHTFLIQSNGSTVEVLGTEFNIRSRSGEKNVQVAVVEGKVAFKSAENFAGSEPLSVFLHADQYAYLDLYNRLLNVDSIAIGNYMVWKTGQLNFENLTLDKICLQLSRIYDIECRFNTANVRSLALSASFRSESLEETLKIISMTLDISYELDNQVVYWNHF